MFEEFGIGNWSLMADVIVENYFEVARSKILPKFSILCDSKASNVCKLYDSASIPLASVFLKCISYSNSNRDVGDPGVGVTFGRFYEILIN